MKIDVKELNLKYKELLDTEVIIDGWVRSNRDQSTLGFIDLNDGTSFKGVQVVYTSGDDIYQVASKVQVGSSIEVKGTVILSEGAGQEYEIKLIEITVLGDVDIDYPLQSKGRPTREFLREIAYLRPRANTFQAVFRVRSVAAYAIHKYFQEKGFVYFHAPLITASDCEGAGEMFQVTTLDLNKVASTGKVDYSKDFFGKQANLTVSGQLEAETFALAYKKVYTFGPTFRAENSNTKTHANEFWMIEPEMAFCDLEGLMDVEEEMLKFVIKYVLDKCPLEIDFCDKFVEKGLKEKISHVLNSHFTRISHHDVIDILKAAPVKWEFEPDYGEDIAKEHEKYIAEYFNGPVFIKDWPKDIKAYYMKLNPDGKTVAAVDLVVPQAGELMGGSQREEHLDVLLARMKEMNVDASAIDWYLDTRRYGGCVHSGFGMGFERLIMYLTGVENIRDVIPFPRTPKNCEY